MNKFNNLIQLADYFSDEQICRDYLEALRWKDGVKCAKCGHDKVYKFKDNKNYKCAKCKKRFSVLVGTIFENTKLPLQKWFMAIYLACNHKKGISSMQLSRDIGITQTTAWFMLHKIREMLKETSPIMLGGVVEVDETYIGGKEKNKAQHKKTDGVQGRSTKKKKAVLGMAKRGGIIVAQPVKNVKKKTLQPIIRERVQIGSEVFSDEWLGYKGLSKKFKHEFIKHNQGEYVRGKVHTNTIEGFWSLLKRGINGTYHHVSDKYLNRYCDHFTFTYNTRYATLEERFDTVVEQGEGKRVKNRELKAVA